MTARARHWAPVIVLLICPPLFSELLSGSVKISTFPVLIPATGVWGCAALLIREFVCWRHGDWRMTFTLGLALAVAEECVIQQTSLAPLVGVPPDTIFGRRYGVNWVYFLWALGFESVWAVAVPIAFTETLFSGVKEQRWLTWRGVTICTIVFVCCSIVAWFTWTQVFVPQYFPDSVYAPPLIAFVLSLAAFAALIGLACTFAGSIPSRIEWCPSLRLLVVLSGIVAFVWYSQVLMAFGMFPELPPLGVFMTGVLLGVSVTFVASRWVANHGWSDRHTMAAILGIVIATACGGAIVLTVSKASTLDRIGHILVNVAAAVWLLHWLWTKPTDERSELRKADVTLNNETA